MKLCWHALFLGAGTLAWRVLASNPKSSGGSEEADWAAEASSVLSCPLRDYKELFARWDRVLAEKIEEGNADPLMALISMACAHGRKPLLLRTEAFQRCQCLDAYVIALAKKQEYECLLQISLSRAFDEKHTSKAAGSVCMVVANDIQKNRDFLLSSSSPASDVLRVFFRKYLSNFTEGEDDLDQLRTTIVTIIEKYGRGISLVHANAISMMYIISPESPLEPRSEGDPMGRSDGILYLEGKYPELEKFLRDGSAENKPRDKERDGNTLLALMKYYVDFRDEHEEDTRMIPVGKMGSCYVGWYHVKWGALSSKIYSALRHDGAGIAESSTAWDRIERLLKDNEDPDVAASYFLRQIFSGHPSFTREHMNFLETVASRIHKPIRNQVLMNHLFYISENKPEQMQRFLKWLLHGTAHERTDYISADAIPLMLKCLYSAVWELVCSESIGSDPALPALFIVEDLLMCRIDELRMFDLLDSVDMQTGLIEGLWLNGSAFLWRIAFENARSPRSGFMSELLDARMAEFVIRASQNASIEVFLALIKRWEDLIREDSALENMHVCLKRAARTAKKGIAQGDLLPGTVSEEIERKCAAISKYMEQARKYGTLFLGVADKSDPRIRAICWLIEGLLVRRPCLAQGTGTSPRPLAPEKYKELLDKTFGKAKKGTARLQCVLRAKDILLWEKQARSKENAIAGSVVEEDGKRLLPCLLCAEDVPEDAEGPEGEFGVLPCGHFAHKQCILMNFEMRRNDGKTADTCFICRQFFPSMEFMFLETVSLSDPQKKGLEADPKLHSRIMLGSEEAP